MNPEIGFVVGVRATTELATAALPDAPVRPGPRRREHFITRRLLGVRSARRR